MTITFDYGEDELETSSMNKDSGLAQLSVLVGELSKGLREVERAEASLKELKKHVEDIQRVLIPELMEELGMDSITTESGLKISIRHVVRASITDKNRDAAVAWFRKEGLDRMLTNQFVLKLKKGQAAQAEKLREKIEEIGLPYENKQTVHHSTLSSFVKERDAAGEETPDDVLNIFRYKEAKIS